MIGVERLVDAGHRGQRREAGIAAAPRDLEPLRDQRAVEPGQRHHVADRAERDEIEPLQQVGLGTRSAYQPASRSARLTATTSRNATPTAASSPCGLVSSSRLG